MGTVSQTRRATTIPSLHERILGDIEGRILTGEWPPGVRIPFEHELSAQYQCSRMTVNKALSELAKAGLIERRRKVGSFVMRAPSRSAVLEIPDVKAEVAALVQFRAPLTELFRNAGQFSLKGAGFEASITRQREDAVAALGAAYRFEILTRRQRRGIRADAGRLEGVAAGPILDLTCRHWAGKKPFCIEERLINLTATPEAADENFAEIAPGPWLLARAPWTRAEHSRSPWEPRAWRSNGEPGAARRRSRMSGSPTPAKRTNWSPASRPCKDRFRHCLIGVVRALTCVESAATEPAAPMGASKSRAVSGGRSAAAGRQKIAP